MLLGIYNFSNSATQGRRSNVINLTDLNSNQAPFPRDQNQVPFPRDQNQVPFPRDQNQVPFPRDLDQIPLAENQSTSQNSTPRAVDTPSELF